MAITKLILSGTNILLKNSSDEIVEIIPSLNCHAYSSNCNLNIVYLTDNPSNREKHDWILPIDISIVTVPTPPIGGWTKPLFLAELNSNYVGKIPPVSIDTTGLATSANQTNGNQTTQLRNSSNEEIGTIAKPIYVNVVNQVDLTAITTLLTDIKNFAQDIDNNTDALEAKLDTINTSINSGNSITHTDLLSVITELQGIDANTDNLEIQLASLISNTNGLATEATLAAIKAQTDKLSFIANELKVTGSLSVTPQIVTSETTTAVNATNVVSTILAANPNRKGYTLYNDSNTTAYIRHAAGATTGVFKFKLDKGAFYEMPSDLNYKGDITAITASGTAKLKVTEII